MLYLDWYCVCHLCHLHHHHHLVSATATTTTSHFSLLTSAFAHPPHHRCHVHRHVAEGPSTSSSTYPVGAISIIFRRSHFGANIQGIPTTVWQASTSSLLMAVPPGLLRRPRHDDSEASSDDVEMDDMNANNIPETRLAVAPPVGASAASTYYPVSNQHPEPYPPVVLPGVAAHRQPQVVPAPPAIEAADSESYIASNTFITGPEAILYKLPATRNEPRALCFLSSVGRISEANKHPINTCSNTPCFQVLFSVTG